MRAAFSFGGSARTIRRRMREDNARLVSGLLPGAELVMMPAAGHLPWLDDPAFVAARTAAFLTRHGEAARGGA